jgi:hypothetical protein
VTAQAGALGQLFAREAHKHATRAQLISGDSDCQHAKNSALNGNSVNANKDSHC